MKTLPGVSEARAVANNGTDYLNAGTLTYATEWPLGESKGWYAFDVLEAATVTAVTFVTRSGTAKTKSPAHSWFNVELPVGMYVSSGIIGSDDVYISALTITGKIALYRD